LDRVSQGAADSAYLYALALKAGMIRNMLLAGLVLFAVADFAYHSYLLEYAPEAVKLRCAHEPIDFVKYQYSRCIARNWHD
jgi:hypothetical protein